MGNSILLGNNNHLLTMQTNLHTTKGNHPITKATTTREEEVICITLRIPKCGTKLLRVSMIRSTRISKRIKTITMSSNKMSNGKIGTSTKDSTQTQLITNILLSTLSSRTKQVPLRIPT